MDNKRQLIIGIVLLICAIFVHIYSPIYFKEVANSTYTEENYKTSEKILENIKISKLDNIPDEYTIIIRNSEVVVQYNGNTTVFIDEKNPTPTRRIKKELKGANKVFLNFTFFTTELALLLSIIECLKR